MNAAVFLDRDGVLVEDVDLLATISQIKILPGVAEALTKLRKANFKLIVVSNQAIVARGLITEKAVEEIHSEINRHLAENGVSIDAFYFCPHHPKATLEKYRVVCECRKPRPGLLFQATREQQIDLQKSFMVGDRITDVIAGAKAGCRTILVQTGQHGAAPIETAEPLDNSIQPDWTCANLREAADWILLQK